MICRDALHTALIRQFGRFGIGGLRLPRLVIGADTRMESWTGKVDNSTGKKLENRMREKQKSKYGSHGRVRTSD